MSYPHHQTSTGGDRGDNNKSKDKRKGVEEYVQRMKSARDL
jgi:hypothetical protein